MQLKDLLYKVTINAVSGSTQVDVIDIHFDSRKVALNDVFVAIRGTVTDGHKYLSLIHI